VSLDCKSGPTNRHQALTERQPLIHPANNEASVNYGSLSEEESAAMHEHSHHHAVASNSSLRSLLLLAALSLHSIFEGLAIGLQENIEEVLQIFAAVVLHKCVIAFGLSLNLVQSKLRTAVVVQLTLIFCLAAPIGLGLGMGVMEFSDKLSSEILSGILQGIACGTFLYVTFFEVLPHELNNNDLRTLKMIFIILGFAASCAIVFLDPDTAKPMC